MNDNILRPKEPFQNGKGQDVYGLTSAGQVVRENGEKLEVDGIINADTLGGVSASEFRKFSKIQSTGEHPALATTGITTVMSSLSLEPGQYIINAGVRWHTANENTGYEVAISPSSEINYNDPTSHSYYSSPFKVNGPSLSFSTIISLTETTILNFLFNSYNQDATIYNSMFRAIKL